MYYANAGPNPPAARVAQPLHRRPFADRRPCARPWTWPGIRWHTANPRPWPTSNSSEPPCFSPASSFAPWSPYWSWSCCWAAASRTARCHKRNRSRHPRPRNRNIQSRANHAIRRGQSPSLPHIPNHPERAVKSVPGVSVFYHAPGTYDRSQHPGLACDFELVLGNDSTL